jgi:hypothetical protein
MPYDYDDKNFPHRPYFMVNLVYQLFDICLCGEQDFREADADLKCLSGLALCFGKSHST